MHISNEEAIRHAFNQINLFKRHRVLAEQARQNGNTSSAIFNELKMYKAMDSLELYIRVLNRNERELQDESDETQSTTTTE